MKDNYYADANTDDGNCCFIGCTDSTRLNFDNHANFDSGLCTPWFNGCAIAEVEGVAATNYKPFYTMDDGSCSFPGCVSEGNPNYKSFATFDDGSCAPAWQMFSCTETANSAYSSIECYTEHRLENGNPPVCDAERAEAGGNRAADDGCVFCTGWGIDGVEDTGVTRGDAQVGISTDGSDEAAAFNAAGKTLQACKDYCMAVSGCKSFEYQFASTDDCILFRYHCVEASSSDNSGCASTADLEPLTSCWLALQRCLPLSPAHPEPV